MLQELRLRIFTGILTAGMFLSMLWMGGVLFRLLAVMIGLSIYYEWMNITKSFFVNLVGKTLEIIVLLVMSCMFVFGAFKPAIIVFLLYFLIDLLISVLWNRKFWRSLGIIYSVLLPVTMVYLRGDGFEGLFLMGFVLSVVWSTDVFAYFIGRYVGGPKIAPNISPGKTWAGSVGGAVCAICAGVVILSCFFLDYFWATIVLSALISVSSQLGDLLESFIKRYFCVKQSGWFLPGHGGVMDRVDGLIFACLVMATVAFLLDKNHGKQGLLLDRVLMIL
ncbi:MAG: phosphatidate cytidylyltransferase [Candidatus Liberibacter europaeus]|uniref:Phosphatidate cytidylyltransferase n=1 Tax=Candidatus Liberibacter europaeus TaxID=744859 RepID=A0A2T4VZ18_9HYPH|nr:phosphatidate cytidylyltransferase [Candidatus Liberibacter europaeus]PTL87029.1 MAG: phosphatidate cytidylyltransferase [Candidatus Liberibacter europaeus]